MVYKYFFIGLISTFVGSEIGIVIAKRNSISYVKYELTQYSITSGEDIYRKHIISIDTGNIFVNFNFKDTAHYKLRKIN